MVRPPRHLEARTLTSYRIQWFRSKPSDPRCPVCKTACIPERDVVPIFGRGAQHQSPQFLNPQTLPVPQVQRRRRPFASRTPSMDAIPAGGTESDSTGSTAP